MRHISDLPPNYGSHRFDRCTPSHHKMALSPHLAQASPQVPRPSRPTPPSTVTSAQVSPHHQRGSTMPLTAPVAHSSLHFTSFVSMGGECPQARPYNCSNGPMAPSPATTGAATPSPRSAAPVAHSSCHLVPFASMGGECPRARPHDRSDGWMTPSPDSFGVSTPSRSPRHVTFFENMGGERTRARPNNRSYGSMAPSPATTGAATPFPISDSPSLPARSPPSPSTKKGGGYYLTARTATPSVRVTPSSHPMAIVEWAARANADDVFESALEILVYWDANASPHEKTLCNEDTAGPLRSLRLPPRERIRANEQSGVRHPQWVCTYLAMSVSPSHPHHQMGGRSTGLMAPLPATTGAAMPLPSLARHSPPTRSTPSHPKRTMGGAPKGRWHPRPLIQGRHRHH
jgi:hypothetical protein